MNTRPRASKSVDRELQALFRLRAFGIKLGLANTRRACARLGNPERSFRSIHVAGTNGKGSVAACIASILRASGARVGLYTSPHLIRFNERIVVDGVKISDERLADLIPRVRAVHVDLTFFEFSTLLAFTHFAEENVDWAVVEVGMGGRLDATNIIRPDVAVLTSVSFDHTEHLGATLPRIAKEKLGVVKPGVHVVCAWRDTDLRTAAEVRCRELSSPLSLIGREFSVAPIARKTDGDSERFRFRDGGSEVALEVALSGVHQVENGALSVRAARLLGLPWSAIRRGLSAVSWPGRLHRVGRLLLDGAHNPDGIRTLVAEVTRRYPSRRVPVIFGAMQDKAIREMMTLLATIASEIHVVRVRDPRGARIVALHEIARTTSPTVPVFGHRTLGAAIDSTSGFTVVTGSIHLVGEALCLVQKKRTARSAVPTGFPLRV